MPFSRTRKPSQKIIESSASITKAKQPPRCRICPGRPFKKECQCKGKKKERIVVSQEVLEQYINEDSTIQNIQDPTPTLTPINEENENGFSSTPRAIAPTTQNNGNEVQNSLEAEASTSFIPITPSTRALSPTAWTFSPSSPNIPDIHPTYLQSGSSPDSDFDITSSLPTTPTPQSRNQNGIQDFLDNTTRSTNPSSRKYPTRKEPVWGIVEGAGKGTESWIIPRPRPLRPKIMDSGASNKRYSRQLPTLIAAVERFARETDGYTMLISQQATGSASTSFYTSPRLRREGKEETLELINEFQDMAHLLTISRREETKKVAKELDQAKKDAIQAKADLERKDIELKELQNRLKELEKSSR